MKHNNGYDKEKDSALIWVEHGQDFKLKTPLFDMYDVQETSADGLSATFMRITPPNWVNIIAPIEREDGKRDILVVRQYRHGLGQLVTELPAGVVDEGEEPIEAAWRELQEETAHSADELVLIGEVCPNPSFMNNRVYTYLALGVRPKGVQALDEHERLSWFYCDEEAFDAGLGTPEFDNGIIHIAWNYYQRYLKSQN